MIHELAEYCRCPSCGGELEGRGPLRCISCGSSYELHDGIPVLLPAYEDDEALRYLASYERLAGDDLVEAVEPRRDIRHSILARFIGDVRGRRILDIGASSALYLRRLDAGHRVALDIALPYLSAIPRGAVEGRVCGDAECLPFAPGFFDVIIISDVLEHVRDPKRVAAEVSRISRPDTRVIVEVPWEEDLSGYSDSKYEFTHLRSFDEQEFSTLWADFAIVRRRWSGPNLETPFPFQKRLLPLPLQNVFRYLYHHVQEFQGAEYELRTALRERLPRYERAALLVSRPIFQVVELRPFASSSEAKVAAWIADRIWDKSHLDGRPKGRTYLRSPAPTAEVPAADRPILMLVAGNPDDDPRITWVRRLCARFGRVLTKGAVLVPELVGRDYDGQIETDRFNAHALAGRRAARSLQMLTKLYGLPSTAKYTTYASSAHERGANRHAHSLESLKLEAGAVARFIAGWSYYYVLIDALYREGRSATVRPRLMICHDLYSLAAAVRLKPRLQCPILYDSHEFWPHADLLARPWETRVVGLLERWLLRRADAVVTVSPPLARALEQYHRLDGVICTPNAEPWDETRARPPEEVSDPVRFLLQGGAAPGRGFEQLLEAWKGVDGARLFIRCPQTAYLDQLREAYGELVSDGRVEFLPPVGEHELVEAARFADVGIIPYVGPNLNHVYCCPNKLSQYMQAGLAVLSNRLEFVGRVIEDADCGVTYDADDPDSVVAAVAGLTADPAGLLTKKRNAFTAARNWFNWEMQSRPYEDAIRRLLEVRS